MKIAYIYYDFLNLYGESGNIKIIENVLKFNKIKYEILYLSLNDELNFPEYDLVYIGSGTENNQKKALEKLLIYKNDIKQYIDENKFILVTGNSVDMFGKRILFDKEYEGLGLFDFLVKQNKRKMEEIYIDSNITNKKILGFINNCSYMNKIAYPIFDNEGIHYNHFFGTYILGPILVRNPEFLRYFMNEWIGKKLKYDLKLEEKAYDEFVKNYMEEVK